jgi:hypothetical protein
MNMFKELLSNPKKIEPGLLQRHARVEFPTVVDSSHLQQRKPDDPIPKSIGSKFVIIGIATYAQDELGLLDRVENSHSLWEHQWQVAVFDVSEWQSSADARKFVTQIPVIAQTPILEMWIDCGLTETLWIPKRDFAWCKNRCSKLAF